MSEYIGVRGEIISCDKNGNPFYNMYLTDEEVIRCCDCKKFETVDCAVYRALRADNRIDPRGMFNSDGFCAWAERRES